MPHSIPTTPSPQPMNPWVRLLQTVPQVRGFILAGLIGTLIDYGFYHLYDNWLTPLLSKGFSFSSATVFVYLMNKFLTFKQPLHSKREISAFFALYTLSMLVNTCVNSLCLQWLTAGVHHYWLIMNGHQGVMASLVGVLASSSGIKLVAFILATSTSTVINFFGQKFWVFELKKSK